MNVFSDLVIFFNKIFKIYRFNSKRFIERKRVRKISLIKDNISKINNIVTVTSNMDSKKHVIYIHGGAFVLGVSRRQEKLLMKIKNKTPIYLSILDYPLAFKNNIEDSLRYLEESFYKLQRNYLNHEFIFMGDSAGGSLVLLLLDRIKNKISNKYKVILISPFLDFNLNNSDISKLQNKDPVLDVSVLKLIVSKYIPANSVLSPIDVDLCDVDVLLVTGDREIFYPDCLAFYKKCLENRCNVIFYKGTKMFHDYVLLDCNQSRKTILKIIEFIEKI